MIFRDTYSLRPSCILASIERLYQSSFIFYTGPQRQDNTQRKLGLKAPKWLRKLNGKSNEDVDKETNAKEKERQRKALQSFANEFRRGVQQQRIRGKTKERAGTLALALSMFRRNVSAHGEVDLLKEVQGGERQTTVSSRRRQGI